MTLLLTPGTPRPDAETWYRYREIQYAAPLNEYDEPDGVGPLELRCDEFRVLRHTPKGVWIVDYDGTPRFVRHEANKKYAYPAKASALESFAARKRRQIRILSAQLQRAKKALEMARKLNRETA